MWNPFRRKALTGTPEVVEALSSRRANFWPLLGGGARQRIEATYSAAQSADLPWLYESSPAVRSVLDLIVRNVGQLDLRLYEEITEAEREPRPDHPAALSMRYPNERETSDHFVRGILTDYLIFGNAYALKAARYPDGRWALVRIPSARVEVKGEQLLFTEWYRIWNDNGTYSDVTDPNSMIHWRDVGTRDPRMGVSKLDTLRNVIAEDAALQQAIVELANSGLVSPVWISRPAEAPEWSNEARDRFEEDLSSRLRRSDKRPATLEEGMELHDFGVSPRDAQALDIRRYVTEQVAEQYGVPWPMKSEDAQALFYSDTLPPYCELFTRWLNHGLLVNEYNLTEYCFEFNLDEKLMGPDRIDAYVSASGAPVMTRNESRARLNLAPKEGGDELITPLNVTVGGKPSPQVMPPQNPLKPPQDGSYREEEPKAYNPNQPRDPGGEGGGRWIAGSSGGQERPSYRKWLAVVRDLNIPGEVTLHRPSKTRVSRNGETEFQVRTGDDGAAGRRRSTNVDGAEEAVGQAIQFAVEYNQLQRRVPKALEPAKKQLEVTTQPRLESDLARQRRNIDKARPVFEQHFRNQSTAMSSKDYHEKALNSERWNLSLTKAILRIIRAIVELEGGIYVSRLGGDDFDMSSPIEDYLEAQAEGAAKGINDATQRDVDQYGAEAALDRARHLRVETAATAVGTRTTVWAREEAAKQAPLPEQRVKTWVANTDRHAELSGQTVPLNASWSFEGRTLNPGSDPQCACSLSIT